MTIRLIIAHPNEKVATRMRMLLETTDDLQVVGVAHDSIAMVTLTSRFRPNVIALSADLYGLSAAFELLRIDTFNGSLLFFHDQPSQTQLRVARTVAPVACCGHGDHPEQILTTIRTLCTSLQPC